MSSSKPILLEKGEIVHRQFPAPKQSAAGNTQRDPHTGLLLSGFWYCDLIPVENIVQEMKRLKSEGIQVLTTGDIAEINGHRNWIQDCCQESGLSFFAPLWGKNRLSAVEDFLSHGFKAVISCVNSFLI